MKLSRLLVAVIGLGISCNLFAASGKAVMASAYADTSSAANTYIKLTNITNAPVDVKVTFYSHDGSVIKDAGNNSSTGLIRGFNGIAYDETLTDASVSITLAANNTGDVRLGNTPSSYVWGYAVIEWEQTDSSVPFGLIAHGFRVVNSGASSYNETSILINGGMPF